nr:SDR family oxidoreductase [Candidatus Sigynarchaeota archaeon]
MITGGGRGIGRSVAVACTKEGANIGLTSRTMDELENVKKDIEKIGTGVKVVLKTGDVTNYSDMDKAFKEFQQELGPLNAVIANAGASSKKESHDFDPAEFARIMNVNVLGVFNTFKAAYPVMNKESKDDKARFIITGSAAYNAVMPKFAAYVASKWAVVGLQKVLALEYTKENISFNMLSPTMVDTRLLRGKKAGDGQKPPTVMDPEELPIYYIFFLLPESNKMNDTIVDVNEVQVVRKVIAEAPPESKASWEVFSPYFEQKEPGLAQSTRKLKRLIEFLLKH